MTYHNVESVRDADLSCLYLLNMSRCPSHYLVDGSEQCIDIKMRSALRLRISHVLCPYLDRWPREGLECRAKTNRFTTQFQSCTLCTTTTVARPWRKRRHFKQLCTRDRAKHHSRSLISGANVIAISSRAHAVLSGTRKVNDWHKHLRQRNSVYDTLIA